MDALARSARDPALRQALLLSVLLLLYGNLTSLAEPDRREAFLLYSNLGLLALGYLGCLLGLFLGGVAFALLRWRTDGVAGPFFLHWVVVALMIMAVWLRN